MIIAALIDEDLSALSDLQHFLDAYPEIFISGKYTDPATALQQLEHLPPNVVFLSAVMAQCSGIALAAEIRERCPETDLIFVSDSDQYALQAFELPALDYILKPIDPARLYKTIARVLKKYAAAQTQPSGALHIQCLGKLQVAWVDQEPIKWRSEKTKELFAYLLHQQRAEISKEELIDILRPNENADKALRQLYNDIYYLKKTLHDYGIAPHVISIDKNYHMRLGEVVYDVARFKTLAKDALTDRVPTLEEMEALYTGNYLEGEDFLWADSERLFLERLYLQCLINLSKCYTEAGRFLDAEILLHKAFAINPYDELITELLLQNYKETGRISECVLHFTMFSALLQKDLGVAPNKKLCAFYSAILSS